MLRSLPRGIIITDRIRDIFCVRQTWGFFLKNTLARKNKSFALIRSFSSSFSPWNCKQNFFFLKKGRGLFDYRYYDQDSLWILIENKTISKWF